MLNKQQQEKTEEQTEGPPLFKTWAGMYGLVIANLVTLIILFYLLTAYYE